MVNLKLGLIKGRHEIPQVTDYVFNTEVNPTDFQQMEITAKATLYPLVKNATKEPFYLGLDSDNQSDLYTATKYRATLDLYVTGLTSALIATINVAKQLDIYITLYHFDRQSGNYLQQEVY